VHVFKPEGEKYRTLEKEPVSIEGTAETVEEPLNGIAGENAVKGFLLGAAEVEEPLAYRGRKISDGMIAHVTLSR
jgi:hypothetical protein